MKIGLLLVHHDAGITSMAFDSIATALANALNLAEDIGMNCAFIQDSETEYSMQLCPCHDDILFVSEVDILFE